MKVNWYKVAFFTVIAVALFLIIKGCDGGSLFGWKKGKDTISVKHDTIYLLSKADTHYVPQPYKVVEYKSVLRYRTDMLELTEIVQVDTSQIVLDYHRRRFYSDTVKIDHGTAIINDTVTENRIAGRSVKTNQRIPVIKETVTIYQPPRNIVYLGFSGTGSKQNFFYSIGTDLSLKTRNDRIYSAGVNLTRDNQVLFEGGVKFPVRLRKR